MGINLFVLTVTLPEQCHRIIPTFMLKNINILGLQDQVQCQCHSETQQRSVL